MAIMSKHFERPTSQKQNFPFARRIFYAVSVAAIGLLTGALGYAIMMIYFPAADLSLYTISGSLRTPVTIKLDQPFAGLVAGVVEHSGIVMRHRQRRGTLAAELFDPADDIAPVYIITSDGWLMTNAPLGTEVKQYDVLLGDALYTPSQIVSDPFTKVIFIKVDAHDLNPIVFANGPVQSGEVLFGNDQERPGRFIFKTFHVSDGAYYPIIGKNDYIKQSDRLTDFILIDGSTVGSLGVAVFNLKEELVGIATVNGLQPLLIPAPHIKISFEQLLKQQKELDFGITYVDRSVILGASKTGITIFNPTKDPVKLLSPASVAHFRKGDVIYAINGEVIDSTHSFISLWRKYQHGSGIKITVIRDGVEGVFEIPQQ